MRKIGQVRYKKDDPQNSTTTPAKLISGLAFEDKNTGTQYKMIQLTIQTAPGVKFYLNNSLEPFVVRADEKNPGYGKYEIDLSEGIYINQLSFDKTTFKLINYLIVDYIYEE